MIKVSVFVDGVQVFELEGEEDQEISIGRAPGCTIRLPEANVSRLHAVLRFSEGEWELEKKKTEGSLKINEEEVENAILQGGEEILIGNFILRINIDKEHIKVKEGAPQVDLSVGDKSFAKESGEGSYTKVSDAVAVAFLHFSPEAAECEKYQIVKERTLVGRASTCEVVIYEKKASRKHFEIYKQGIRFHIKDLGSANHTFVNGNEVTEAELNSGDKILVGDTEIRFSAESKGYFAKQEQFLEVPEEALHEEGLKPAVSLAEQQPAPAKVASQEVDAVAREKSLFKRRWKQFQKMPRRQRLMVLLVVLIVSSLVFSREGEKKRDRKGGKPKVQRDADGKIIRNINTITEKDRRTVQKAYEEVLTAREEGNYKKMLDNLSKIFRIVDDYRDAKAYQKDAEEGIARREKLLAERKKELFQKKLREEVDQLVQKGELLFEKALKDPQARPLLEGLIQQIYTKDPNNRMAQAWQNRIKEKALKEKEEKERGAQQKKLRKEGEGLFKVLEELVKKGKYLEAMSYADAIPAQTKYRGNRYLERVLKKNQEARKKLNDLVNPLLEEAAEERKAGGDLVKSKNLYRKVLELEPKNESALSGLGAIRSVLHLRAKRLYTQGVLAESLGSLEESKQKLKLCVKVAPEGGAYERRCKAKLVKYEPFSKENK